MSNKRMVTPEECYVDFGADLEGCSRQQGMGCQGCYSLVEEKYPEVEQERVPCVKTVVDTVYPMESMTFDIDLCDNKTLFQLQALANGRSYEDRSVYYEMGSETGWLKGEDAIKLGQKLIEHGAMALNANMLNHQLIHEMNALKKYIEEGRVEKLILKVLKDQAPNYGDGHKIFRIIPIWIEGKAPEYVENFCFDQVIYFSPIRGEFQKEVKAYKVPVEFEGYDRDKVEKDFQEQMRLIEEATAHYETVEVKESPIVEGSIVGDDTLAGRLRTILDHIDSLYDLNMTDKQFKAKVHSYVKDAQKIVFSDGYIWYCKEEDAEAVMHPDKLEHLLNCLDNQKFIHEQSAETQAEWQEIIDKANHEARNILSLRTNAVGAKEEGEEPTYPIKTKPNMGLPALEDLYTLGGEYVFKIDYKRAKHWRLKLERIVDSNAILTQEEVSMYYGSNCPYNKTRLSSVPKTRLIFRQLNVETGEEEPFYTILPLNDLLELRAGYDLIPYTGGVGEE